MEQLPEYKSVGQMAAEIIFLFLMVDK